MKVPEIFASKVFNDKVALERLPKEVYASLKNTINGGEQLSLDVANKIANAMKDWAIEQGATHFTHWFQPMTGITAEKHDSFISPDNNGGIIMEFSGKELIKGEPDASSFPSGGLRATFEARGYTSWDPSSFAFIKNNTLYIPTAFCSYSGESLDKKTPLLRSMDVLDKEATRLLNIIGVPCNHVITTVGPEQEYFLIDKTLYEKRPDLIICGRTLLGAKAPKGQDLDDHYFGAIKPRVASFMKELDEELWKLGVLAKTKHNESAPCQHELACIYTTANIAADNNQLVMELMKEIAEKYGFACLLSEKPFAYVNGSGKHNNWSIMTDNGVNLLAPGKAPSTNIPFLLIMAAVIKAVDNHADLLRISVASAGNDRRLGGNEAPPPIISMFIGDNLVSIFDELVKGNNPHNTLEVTLKPGANVLPTVTQDSTDRNRTSPFAFTGNKFELRMLGSSFSISDSNTVLNTIVAESFKEIADKLQNATNIESEIINTIKDLYSQHNRIIFNGNNYSAEWGIEANKRGLPNLKTTPDALSLYDTDKNINLFERFGIFTKEELAARKEIYFKQYVRIIHMEAVTLIDMVYKYVIPSILDFSNCLSTLINSKKSIKISSHTEEILLNKLTSSLNDIYDKIVLLRNKVDFAKTISCTIERAMFNKNTIIPLMDSIREICDSIEVITPKKYIYLPTYFDILFDLK